MFFSALAFSDVSANGDILPRLSLVVEKTIANDENGVGAGAELQLFLPGLSLWQAWRFTNKANSFHNLMVTANVCMCGSDGTFDSMGEAMVVNFDGAILAHGTTGRAATRDAPLPVSERCHHRVQH